MTVLVPLTIIVGGSLAAGFIASWKQRRADRHHFAAFVGFSSGIVAVTTTAILWLAAAQPANLRPAWQGFMFLSGAVGIISSLVTLLAGLFSDGIQRFALVICATLMGLIYLLTAFSNFGA
jgi:hypothetical protein